MDNDKQMDNVSQSTQTKPKNNLFKILALVLIVVAIAGIFIFKNLDKTEVEAPSASNNVNANGVDYNSREFALDATENFDMDQILSYGLPVLIDFGADSCMPCKEMAPVLKELNQELRGKVIVKFVDVWKNAAAGEEMPLRAIPTQFFFNADGLPYAPKDGKAAANQGFLTYMDKETEKHVLTAHEGGMTKEAILAVLAEMGVK